MATTTLFCRECRKRRKAKGVWYKSQIHNRRNFEGKCSQGHHVTATGYGRVVGGRVKGVRYNK